MWDIYKDSFCESAICTFFWVTYISSLKNWLALYLDDPWCICVWLFYGNKSTSAEVINMQGRTITSWKIQSDGNVRETSMTMSSTVWALLTTGWSLAGSSATVCVTFFCLLRRVVKSFSYAWDWNMSNNSEKKSQHLINRCSCKQFNCSLLLTRKTNLE